MTSSLKSTYYGLGKNWWKQLIDGCYHQYGKMVFDKGLHRGHTEPGYYAGIKEASKYAIQQLSDNQITLEMYKKIQAIACSHFNGIEKTGTAPIGAIGKFKTSSIGTRSIIPFAKWSKDVPPFPETLARRTLIGLLKKETPTEHLAEKYNWYKDSYSAKWEKLGTESERFIKFYNDWYERLKEINKNKNAPDIEMIYDELSVSYESNSDYNKKTQAIFDDFHKQIDSAKEDMKLRLIAKLFQDLDWLHPFEDGQGRTDQIVMNILLCKYGFNPAILDEPYYATYHTLDEWVTYLKQGISQWKKEQTPPTVQEKLEHKKKEQV